VLMSGLTMLPAQGLRHKGRFVSVPEMTRHTRGQTQLSLPQNEKAERGWEEPAFSAGDTSEAFTLWIA
jgi:hypothetical protein